MVNAVEFKNALSRWKGERLPLIARELNKVAAERLGAAIIYRMPVKTGRARGNVRLFVGNQNPKGYDPNSYDPVGVITFERLKQAARRLAAYSSFVIYCNVPYMGRLEQGWSKQAPLGVFRVALLDFRAGWTTAAREIKGRVGGSFVVR